MGQHNIVMPNLDKHINFQDFCHAVPSSVPDTVQPSKTRENTASDGFLLKEHSFGSTSGTPKMLPHSDRRQSILAFEHEGGLQIAASVAEVEAGLLL